MIYKDLIIIIMHFMAFPVIRKFRRNDIIKTAFISDSVLRAFSFKSLVNLVSGICFFNCEVMV